MPFSFNRHGPFYRLQRRLGLVNDADLAVGRRAALFVAVAWIPAVLLAAMQGLALDPHHERAILLDFSAYALAIAVACFVLMEQTTDTRMAHLVAQFEARGIVPEASRTGIAKARANMERRTGSWLAEAAILVVAYGFAYLWLVRAPMSTEAGA